MGLNSFAFLLGFLPLVAIGVHVLHDRYSPRVAQMWVLAASVGFYGLSGPRYVPVVLASILFNWAIGRSFDSPRFGEAGRKRLLWLGLAVDILVLCLFKYASFLLGAFEPLIGHRLLIPSWGFPLGISFFTIAQVMYLVDRYERLVRPNSLVDHGTFVFFFPNITAGPIERAKHVVEQFGTLGEVATRDDRLARGIALLAIGLFKKVVIADSFARVANAGYAHVATLSTAGAWLTSLAYTFEIYFDFSGYSDMALGAARLLGVSLVQNFDAPYRARTISEFWQRWHISLSRFITTYLYTPMVRGMGRVTIHKSTVATLLAMTIAGLWHGPAWTFVLWGTFNGVGLAGYQYWKRAKRPMPPLIATLVTFAFVNLGMILFRSPTVATAMGVAGRLLPSDRLLGIADIRQAIPSAVLPMIALPLVFGSIAAFVGPTSNEIAERFPLSVRAALAIGVTVAIAFMFMLAGTQSDFAYRAF